ncbi:MAG: hypothetical protein AAGK14_02225 [Verrucomicrobiota bacterium]
MPPSRNWLCSLGPFLLAALALVALGPESALAAKSEAKSWYDALDVGRRTITMAMVFTIIGIVISYLLVGRGARDLLAAGFSFGFIFYSNPEVFEKPGPALEERWLMLSSLQPDETMLLSILFLLVGLFFLIKGLAVLFEHRVDE